MIYSHCPRYNFPRFVPSIISPPLSPLLRLSPLLSHHFLLFYLYFYRYRTRMRPGKIDRETRHVSIVYVFRKA